MDEERTCAERVVISCWNSSTASNQSTVMATHMLLTTSTFTVTMSSSSPQDFLQPTSSMKLKDSKPKSSTAITVTSTAVGATSSSSPGVESSASILFGAIGAVIGLLLLAILLTMVYICCRRRHVKEPIVQDCQYEVPISGQRNKMFHKIDQTTTLPETEILYDRAATATAHQAPDEAQVYHTLNHSPATAHHSSAMVHHSPATLHHSPAANSSQASKNSRGSSGDLPLNEVLYEKVIPSCTNLHRDPPTQKPPVYYHTLVNSQETSTTTDTTTTTTPHYHVPERLNTVHVSTTPHYHVPEKSSDGNTSTMPHYHVLEGSNAGQMSTMPHYHVLEGSNTSHVEPPYHEVGRRKAATLPAQRTTRPTLNIPSRSLRLARHGGSATLI